MQRRKDKEKQELQHLKLMRSITDIINCRGHIAEYEDIGRIVDNAWDDTDRCKAMDATAWANNIIAEFFKGDK